MGLLDPRETCRGHGILRVTREPSSQSTRAPTCAEVCPGGVGRGDDHT